MGEAYEKLLQAADDDADIRAMLVDSQKRWLAERDRLFDRRLASADKDAQRAIMLSAIQDRTRVLTEPSGSPPQQPALIIIAQEQRKFTGRYTGGSFAGFDTSCEFLPVQDSYVYGCFGSRQYQNYSRVCTVSRYWATGRVYEKRSVAEITDDKARVIATCSVDGVEGDTTCPGGSGEDRRWDTLPKADAPAAKIDAGAIKAEMPAGRPLSDADVVTLAVQNNPDLTGAALTEKQAAYAVRAEEARYPLVLQANAGYTRSSARLLTSGVQTTGAARNTIAKYDSCWRLL